MNDLKDKADCDSPKRGDRCRGECDCCAYETGLHFTEQRTGSRLVGAWLCEVCYSTFLSKAVFYPIQVSDTALYRSVGYIANMLLDEIRGLKTRDTKDQ
jgi:hypothetical protein